jgi:hypothetical protein
MRRTDWVLVGALASLAGGCTTALYKGPARPDSEVSLLTSRDARIIRVDQVALDGGNSSSYQVLPGDHEVAVALNRTIPGLLATTIQRSRPIIVCVELDPGHVYRIEPVVTGARWVPQVVDTNDRKVIDPYCDEEASAPKPPAPVAVAAPPAPSASRSASSAPTPAAPDEVAPVPAAPPGPPVAAAVDRETPRVAPAPASGETSAQLSGRRPGTGFSLFTGFGFGGDDFVKATSSTGNDESLSAGTGLILGVGGMLTPLWVGDAVGFGLGIDAGLKYDSIDASNGSASITRYPIALSVHALANASGGHHYLMLKGGVIRDFGVSYNASGFASVDASPTGTWGPLGEVGYYRPVSDSFAWDLMAFFALTKHVAPGGTLNADSFGLTVGLHYNL